PPGPPSSSTRGPLLRSVPRARGDSQLIRLRCAPPGCSSPLDPLLLPLVARSFGASHEPGGIRSSSGSAALRRAAPPPWTPFFFHSWPAPSERPPSQGGFASPSAPLRPAGLLLPPGPPSSSTRGPLLRRVPRARGDSQLIRLRCAPPGCSSPLDPLLLPLVARSFGASHEPGGIRSSSGSAALRRAAPPPWTPLIAGSPTSEPSAPPTPPPRRRAAPARATAAVTGAHRAPPGTWHAPPPAA